MRHCNLLALSTKNAMSVAATVYATDCVARMVMDVVPDEIMEEYVEPVIDYISSSCKCYTSEVNEVMGKVYDYFNA